MSADAPAVPFSSQSVLGETSRDPTAQQQIGKPKRKRNGPGKPDPAAEVVALSVDRLLATGIYVCEVCQRGFQRNQNLVLHRRIHNLEGSLQKSSPRKKRKQVYICPEPSCVHHDPSRALGDITGIKKHYVRKHCERTWKCEKCNKMYATESDMKGHYNRCNPGRFRCDRCGEEFSRNRSYVAHLKDCNVPNQEYNSSAPFGLLSDSMPGFPGLQMMPAEGANDAPNMMAALPVAIAPHPLMPPSSSNFNERMGSMNGMHHGQPADKQVPTGLPMPFEENGMQGNMESTQQPPPPPPVDLSGDASGMWLPEDYSLLGGNGYDLPPTDPLAYMDWWRF